MLKKNIAAIFTLKSRWPSQVPYHPYHVKKRTNSLYGHWLNASLENVYIQGKIKANFLDLETLETYSMNVDISSGVAGFP